MPMPSSSSSSPLSLSFSKVFLRQFFTQVVINVVRFPFFDYSLDISSLHTLCYTSLFPMLTGQMVLSFLLHCHISKFCKCFWSTSRSDQITTPHNAMYRLQHFSNFFLKNNFGLLVEISLRLLECYLCYGSPGKNFTWTRETLYI